MATLGVMPRFGVCIGCGILMLAGTPHCPACGCEQGGDWGAYDEGPPPSKPSEPTPELMK